MKRLLFVFLILTIHVNAQQPGLKSAFISVGYGINDITQSQFSKVYDSNIGVLPAISLGLPLSTRTYLYGKVSYFIKNGIPTTNTTDIHSGQSLKDSKVVGGSSKYYEWIINAGILTKTIISEDYAFDIDGGLFFVNEKNENKYPDGTIIYSSSDHGLMGLFGGIVFERNFGKSPFSLIADMQFNLSIPGVLFLIPNNGGLNATLGLRYYFKERRIE